jgi:hypothetical protein
MKITLEISVEEFVKLEKWNAFKQRMKEKLSEEQNKEEQPEDFVIDEDLKILSELKEKPSEDEQPEDPAPEQTTSKVEVLIDGEGWKTFDCIEQAAKAIDARKEHLLFALENNKTCNGMRVRYYNPDKKKSVSTKSVKVEKRSKEYPDSVIEVYNSIRKCANLNGIGYANLSKQLKEHKKYEYGPYIFKLVDSIDDAMKEIKEKNKKPYEISKK